MQPSIRPHLLWEYNLADFDFQGAAAIVVERVVERGTIPDWKAIVEYYGAEKVVVLARLSKQLQDRDKAFAARFVYSNFLKYKYNFIAPLCTEKDIRMASLLDIAAMKLNAIAHNGTRYKDFIDMYFLLEHHSFATYLQAFEAKYPQTNAVVALKGIEYFNDIDFDFDKPVLIKPLSFNMVKKRLLEAVQFPEKVF